MDSAEIVQDSLDDPGRSTGYPGLSFVHDMLDLAAARRPSAPAVRDSAGKWTYAELAEYSGYCTGWLRACGVRRGDRVVVEVASDRRVVAVLFACSRMGAVFVPLGAGIKGRQRDDVIRNADPALIIETEADLPPFETAQPEQGDCFDASRLRPEEPALLIYTSGSTATPKGVVCPHKQIVFATTAIAERLEYRASDIVFCRLPLSFDYGLYQVFLCTMATAELVLAEPGSTAGLLAALRQVRATVVPVLPSLAAILVRLAERDRQPTTVRLFTNTGENLPHSMIDRLRDCFPGAGVQLMFGITECKRVSIMDADGDRARRDSVGRPLPGTMVTIADAHGAALPPMTIGEIVVSGPNLTDGYWQAEDLTARVFRTDPVSGRRAFHTGDYGYLDSDGYLYFVGRRDGLYKNNGVRTSTLEIEAAALELADVHAAAVVPPDGLHSAVLYVISSLTSREVLHRLRSRLDPLKVPAVCRVVESLPLGATGKVDRRALGELAGRELNG